MKLSEKFVRDLQQGLIDAIKVHFEIANGIQLTWLKQEYRVQIINAYIDSPATTQPMENGHFAVGLNLFIECDIPKDIENEIKNQN